MVKKQSCEWVLGPGNRKVQFYSIHQLFLWGHGLFYMYMYGKWDTLLWGLPTFSNVRAPQIETGDSRIGAIFLPAWSSNWAYLGFYHDENNRDLSGVHVTCICCGPSMKINMHETLQGVQRSLLTHFACVCFCLCGGQKPEYLQLELHGWGCHHMGLYRRSPWMWHVHYWPSETQY